MNILSNSIIKNSNSLDRLYLAVMKTVFELTKPAWKQSSAKNRILIN